MWCAYELATFLRDPKKQKPIQIMPVKMAVVLFLFAGCEVCVMVGFFWMPEFTLRDGGGHFFEQLFWFWLSLAPFVLLSVPVTFYIGISLFEDLQELPQQMANFSVRHAQCFCCSNDHRHSGRIGFRVGRGAFGELGSTLACSSGHGLWG